MNRVVLLKPWAHARLALLGFAKPMLLKEPEGYLLANGWSRGRDQMGEFWHQEDNAPWILKTAIRMQQTDDACTYLESRGWKVTGGFRGCRNQWTLVHELLDPAWLEFDIKKRVKSYANATYAQLERDEKLIEETVSKLDPPNAPSVLQRGNKRDCHLWIVPQCPLCGEKHMHGGGPSDGNPHEFLGHRIQHCSKPPPGARGYFLVAS